jgi:hypothetical protein
MHLLKAILEIATAADFVAQRQALRHYIALLLLYAWLGYEILEEEEKPRQWWRRWRPRRKKQDYTAEKDAVLVGYIWLQIVMQREEGRLPAWEGIRIVRERRGG